MKTTLSVNEVTAIKWHLQSNVFPPLNEVAQDGVIKNINEVRSGEKHFDDEIISGSGVSIGQMLDDLQLNEYAEIN